MKGLLRTLQANAIILTVLAETIFILGLFIALWSGDGFDILRAGFIALVLLAINFRANRFGEKIVMNSQEV